jgi:hypothetical protein
MPYLAAFEPGINLPSKNWSSYNVRTIELEVNPDLGSSIR